MHHFFVFVFIVSYLNSWQFLFTPKELCCIFTTLPRTFRENSSNVVMHTDFFYFKMEKCACVCCCWINCKGLTVQCAFIYFAFCCLRAKKNRLVVVWCEKRISLRHLKMLKILELKTSLQVQNAYSEKSISWFSSLNSKCLWHHLYASMRTQNFKRFFGLVTAIQFEHAHNMSNKECVIFFSKAIRNIHH